MKLSEFKKWLSENADKKVVFILPTGSKLPVHTHVTEVARMEKKFVDCGGTFRVEATSRLQTWFSDDTDHRLTAAGLGKAVEKASAFLETDDLELDVECEAPFVSQFPIASIRAEKYCLEIYLGVYHTACLAPEYCLPPKIDLRLPIKLNPKSPCC